MVGYNVQTAVEARHHLIVAHEVTNTGHDRAQLNRMAVLAKEAIGSPALEVVADRGHFRGEEIRACDAARITTYLPKPQTSSNLAKGLFGKRDFLYQPDTDTYACPAGERLIYPFHAAGEWLDHPPVLVFSLSALPPAFAMHDGGLPSGQSLGTRGRGRGRRATSGPAAGTHAGAPVHG